MSSVERILVSGASGQLGQMVLEQLLKRGQSSLIATTRTPERLQHFAERGVEVRRADFKDEKGLEGAFRGATKLLLISTTDIGARALDQAKAVEAAKRVGVQHVFYTSLPNPETSVAIVAPDHVATEKALVESGLRYTFLRNSYYAENVLVSLSGAIETGTLYGCAGEGRAAYVSRADCAEAAAAALIRADELVNEKLDITGPFAHSHAEVAEFASKILGRPLVYKDLSADDFRGEIVRAGFPDMYSPFFVSMDLAVKNGSVERISNEVSRLTSREPERLESVLRRGLTRKSVP